MTCAGGFMLALCARCMWGLNGTFHVRCSGECQAVITGLPVLIVPMEFTYIITVFRCAGALIISLWLASKAYRRLVSEIHVYSICPCDQACVLLQVRHQKVGQWAWAMWAVSKTQWSDACACRYCPMQLATRARAPSCTVALLRACSLLVLFIIHRYHNAPIKILPLGSPNGF